MASVNRVLEVYLDLADWYEQRGQAQLRDRFLVLAADASLSAGRGDEAERLRSRLLQQNPHHLLKPYASLAEAMKVPAVQDYMADLRRSYTHDIAEQQLQSLRANADVPPAKAPPAKELPAKEPPPIPRPAPPKPRSPEPPPKDSPDVQLFYPMKDEGDDAIPHTMPIARKKPGGEPLFKPSAPLPPSSSPRPPAPESPPTQRPAAKKPPRFPVVSPFLTERAAPVDVKRGPVQLDHEDLSTGYWVATILFGILLLAGMALAIYTVARPFLPPQWFRN